MAYNFAQLEKGFWIHPFLAEDEENKKIKKRVWR